MRHGLRNIVKTAGVTTGAFYGYYKSKEELFDALVCEQAEYVLSLFDTTLGNFNKLSGEEQTQMMTDISGDAMFQMVNYMYDYYDEFKLLILCAEGTKYVDFIHQLHIAAGNVAGDIVAVVGARRCHDVFTFDLCRSQHGHRGGNCFVAYG